LTPFAVRVWKMSDVCKWVVGAHLVVELTMGLRNVSKGRKGGGDRDALHGRGWEVRDW
jgi:hypothetical protein